MKYNLYSFRHSQAILKHEFNNQYDEILSIIHQITDNEIIEGFECLNSKKKEKDKQQNKSLSVALNNVLKEKFKQKKWKAESKIFKDKHFNNKTWSIDFAKEDISLEVAFNHGTVAAWNLIKPTIAGELNHIQKQNSTKIGVIITATEELKRAGGFDNSIGTYESYIKYIQALNNILTIPILLIGLKAPTTFKIEHLKDHKNRTIGKIKK